MDRVSRLNLLFREDKDLLSINTGLHVEPSPEPEEPGDKQTNMVSVSEADAATPSFHLKQASDEQGGLVKNTGYRVDNTGKHIDPTACHTGKNGSPPQADVKLASSFCPLTAVSRYPYKHVKGELSQKIASQLFDEGKFWNRQWDLYYVPVPGNVASRPLLLVPAAQVQQLLDEINAKHSCDLSLLKNPPPGLALPFHDDGTPQPLFLGKSANRETKCYLESKIRGVHLNPTDYSAEQDEMIAFEEKIQAGVDQTKNKRKATKTERQQERHHIQLDYERCLTRIQCYFGLQDGETIDESFENFGKERTPDLPPLDIKATPSFPMWKNPVLISFDVESNELSHSQVTEIGISVLDTQDLIGVPPGQNMAGWTSQIQSRHFRVREYANVVNNNFVSGCPDKFEFGQSEWVASAELVAVFEECFRIAGRADIAQTPRNIIVVGHGVACDLKYLREQGATIFDTTESSPAIIERIDTAQLFRVWKKEQQQRALAKVLDELGILAWNLHNAGNDARYTLEAAVRMAVKVREGVDAKADIEIGGEVGGRAAEGKEDEGISWL